jgi:hypothetical protein
MKFPSGVDIRLLVGTNISQRCVHEIALEDNRVNLCFGRMRRCKRAATEPAVPGWNHVEYDCCRLL